MIAGRRPLLDRLTEKVRGPWADASIGPDDCWLWTGDWRSRYGYGRLRAGGHNSRQLVAHRAMYEEIVGPLPADRLAGHTCNVPLCCNPGHIYPATYAENYRDTIANGYTNAGRGMVRGAA